MILDLSDLRTAWQDSDFITDCLCWHNVYRQRHGSPQLSMNSEVKQIKYHQYIVYIVFSCTALLFSTNMGEPFSTYESFLLS